MNDRMTNVRKRCQHDDRYVCTPQCAIPCAEFIGIPIYCCRALPPGTFGLIGHDHVRIEP